VTSASLTLASRPISWRPIGLVFLPFAAGYYLTYLFRTINALIASRLMADLGLGAADLGVLTSVFFLSLAAIQLPLGILLDRYGPRRVQITLLPIAALGATLFATADSFATLVIGRALIGIGVAGSLMSGLKAIILWFPRERISLANGCFIMLGALGAVTATAPVESLLVSIGWRGLFELLAIVSAGCALILYLVVPETWTVQVSRRRSEPIGLKSIYCDPRFWRLAPLSASCIGSAWALHGLWAAPWLADVAGLDQPAVVQHLFVMAVAACGGALLLGLAADRLRRQQSGSDDLLTVVAALFIAAQFALMLSWPVPTVILWAIVAGVGAATVLSFAILAENFPIEVGGQANAALNLLHVGGAFVLQSGIGLVIGQWAPDNGRYPTAAYQTAFAINIALQIAAFLWFIKPDRQARNSVSIAERAHVSSYLCAELSRAPSPYELATRAWDARLASARAETAHWRWAAFGSGALSVLFAATLVVSAGRVGVMPHIVAVEQFSSASAVSRPNDAVQPSDAQIAYALSHFVEDIRSLSTDAVVVRAKWARAYAMVTDHGAETLNAYAGNPGRFTPIGARAVIAKVTSVIRASDDSFEIHWNESSFENEAPAKNERFTAIITVVLKAPDSEKPLGKNPCGVYVHNINWSHDVARLE